MKKKNFKNVGALLHVKLDSVGTWWFYPSSLEPLKEIDIFKFKKIADEI